MKVALVANAEIRDNGTFAHVRPAVKQLLGMPLYGLNENLLWLQRGYPYPDDNDIDVAIAVDDGRDDIEMVRPPGKNTAIWLIDTHLGPDIRVQWARHYDFVFCAQQSGVELMAEYGIAAHWLPLACNPLAHPNQKELMERRRQMEEAAAGMADEDRRREIYQTIQSIFMDSDLSKCWDVVFVGYMNRGVPGNPKSHSRLEVLDTVFKAFRNSWLVTGCFEEQMAARYIKGRVGFNVSILDDLNMRSFEIPSIGTAMLVNRDQNLESVGLKDGVHYFGYDDVDEAIAQANWMLRNPLEREAVAQAGHDLVREKHCYVHRIAQMFSIMGVDYGAGEESQEGAGGTESQEGDAGTES